MKKGILFCFIIILSFTIISCSKNKADKTSRIRLLDMLPISETLENKRIAKKVIEGIKEKDVDKIKNLFSKQSLSEIPDIDGQIKILIDSVNKINIKEYQIDNGFEGMHWERGIIEEWSRCCFIWYPNYEDSKYRMIITYYKTNLINPDLEGIICIEFYQGEKYDDLVEIIKIGNNEV